MEHTHTETAQPAAPRNGRISSLFTRTFLHSSAWERFIFSVLFLLALGSGTLLLFAAQQHLLVTVPQEGGTFTEGIVGAPRNITPARATSQSDLDLVSVVYAGLLTRNATGELVPELAESYTVSEDGRTYTFILKNDIHFHDGTPLTSSDIAFTVKHIQDPAIRSTLATRWANVVVETPDTRTVVFTLPQPLSSFVEECTVGILPEHTWGALNGDEYAHTELNIRPIGAGPYKVSRVDFDESGIATQYHLGRFSEYALGAPYLKQLLFTIYRNQEAMYTAFVNNEVDAIAGVHGTEISAITELRNEKRTTTTIYHAPMLRVFAVFLNQNNQRLFTYPEVRKAVTTIAAANRTRIVSEVFAGYGSILEGPSVHRILNTAATSTVRAQDAETLLTDEGWERESNTGMYAYENKTGTTPLSFELSTVETLDLTKTAQILTEAWKQYGIDAQMRVYDPADFTQLVVRPRNYEALLFGFDIGHNNDLYAFWHSSARNDPGLNVAQYADIESDALLEEIRKTNMTEERNAKIEAFTELLAEENNVVFLYAPHSTYLVSSAVKNIVLHPLANTSERFDTVHTWYRESENVWPFLGGR